VRHIPHTRSNSEQLHGLRLVAPMLQCGASAMSRAQYPHVSQPQVEPSSGAAGAGPHPPPGYALILCLSPTPMYAFKAERQMPSHSMYHVRFLPTSWWQRVCSVSRPPRHTTCTSVLRCDHGAGQYKPIHAVRFIIGGTIEERILKLQDKKRAVFEGTVGKDATALVSLLARSSAAVVCCACSADATSACCCSVEHGTPTSQQLTNRAVALQARLSEDDLRFLFT
jgi:hypothetical protein